MASRPADESKAQGGKVLASASCEIFGEGVRDAVFMYQVLCTVSWVPGRAVKRERVSRTCYRDTTGWAGRGGAGAGERERERELERD